MITSSKDDIHNGGLPERSSTLVEKKEEEEGEEKVKQKEEEEVKVKQKEEEEVKVKEEVKEEEKVKEEEAKGGVVKVQKGFDIGELSKIAQELKENNAEIRSGSSSPCPSIGECVLACMHTYTVHVCTHTCRLEHVHIYMCTLTK